MLTLITGVPGAGKSYYAFVTFILPELLRKSGRRIITNIPVNVSAITHAFGYESAQTVEVIEEGYFSMDLFTDDNEVPIEGALYLFDECQEMLTKEKVEENPEEFKYLTRHRKYVNDIVLLTQNPGLISRKVRALVEMAHYLSKTRIIGGKAGGYIVKTYAGQSSRSKPINQAEYEYKSEYFQFYQSYSKDGLKEIDNVQAKFLTRFVVFVYKNRINLIIFLVIFAGLSFYRAASSHGKPRSGPSVEDKRDSFPAPEAPAKTPSDSPNHRKNEKPASIEGVTGFEFEKSSAIFEDGKLLSCYMRRYPSSAKDGVDSVVDQLRNASVVSSSSPSVAYRRLPCDYMGSKVVRREYGYTIKLPDGREVY